MRTSYIEKLIEQFSNECTFGNKKKDEIDEDEERENRERTREALYMLEENDKEIMFKDGKETLKIQEEIIQKKKE